MTANATRSGNPAKKAAAKKTAAAKKEEQLEVSNLADFKARKKGKILELPSGLFGRFRRPDLQEMVIKGDVPNPLMKMVHEALEKGDSTDLDKVTGQNGEEVDLETVREMYEVVNMLVCEMGVEPKIFMDPEDPADIDDELLYVSELEDDDKMFLFQWAMGGTDDLATFREEARKDLAALAEGKSNKPAAKRAARATPKKR